MTKNQTEETRAAVQATVLQSDQTFGGKLAAVIDDPFHSALAATAACGLAITFVLTGMWAISLAVY